jgi:hypothetical protein
MSYIFKQNVIFEIPHDLMPIPDRIDAVQGDVKKRLSIIFVPPGRNCVDDLVKI